MNRRELLQAAGAGIATAALGGGGVALAKRPRKPTLTALAKSLRGTLVTPSSSSWAAAAQIWNPYVQSSPRAIAFCQTPRDVAAVLKFARQAGWPVAARSGRHSFAGYCNVPGIVADLSQMDATTVNASAGTVTVGAGLTVLGSYEQLLLPQGITVATGTCPTVGMGGLVLGGGISRIARQIGTTSDTLVSAQVVLPSGEIVTASATQNADLFWALRGGGGGNFGIVTSFTLQSFPATGSVVGFGMSFPWGQAAEALNTWQTTIPQAPGALGGSVFRATNTPAVGAANGTLGVYIGGGWSGAQGDLQDILAPLLALNPVGVSLGPVPFAQAWKPDGCTVSGSSVSCPSTLYPNYQRSDFVNEPLSAAAIQTMLDATAAWPGGVGGDEGGVQIEAFGSACAVNQVAPDATAFVHRNSQTHITYLNFWGPQNPPAVALANVAWVDKLYTAMRPYVSGFSYQNYIDPGLGSWARAYYGDNYARLQKIKAQVDPDDLLAFQQGIRPAKRR
jgi:FAD/FMN-containing dehydrogenase